MNYKNILIVRTDRIGDLVLTMPMASVLKKVYPDVKITFLINSYTRSLIQNNPYIDEIIELKMNNGKIALRENINLLKDKNFDTAILVHPKFRLALILFLSGIKTRIGTAYRWYSFLLNNKLKEHRKKTNKHELEHNLTLLKTLDITEEMHQGDVEFGIKPDKEALIIIEDVLKQNNISEKFIVVHPGSGGSSIDLPLNHFKEIIARVRKNLPEINIVLTGSEVEKEICEGLVFDEKVHNFAGKFSLLELIAIISKSSIFVANSTGPLHIAAALGINVVGFYPKIQSCAKERWGPYTKKAKVFNPELDCNNCTREQCERLNCMSSIKPENVYHHIQQVLSNL